MAMVGTLPFTNNQTTFGRYASQARRNSDLMDTASGLSARSNNHHHSAQFTLESLAAQLSLLSSSPTDGFTYLSQGDFYNTNNQRTPLVKSKSFPSVGKACPSTKPTLRKAKSVRFADSQGLPLVAAVHQLTCLDSSYTANKIVPYTDDISVINAQLKSSAKTGDQSSQHPSSIVSTVNSGSATFNPSPLTMDTSRHITVKQCHSSPILKRQNSPSSPVSSPSTHRHRFGFSQPSLEPDFFQRVVREGVVLDSIREEPRSLHGIVRVSNLAYEKDVVVRWTHDDWRTSHDTRAYFCASDGTTDRFGFELPINGDDVVFCIRYTTLRRDYWDNNRGQNYTVFSE